MAGYYSSPLSLSSSLPGFVAWVLINTAALARCQGRLSEPQLFQQFVPPRTKPSKRLRATWLLLRPAEAVVPIQANGLPVETSGPALRSHTALVAGDRIQLPSDWISTFCFPNSSFSTFSGRRLAKSRGYSRTPEILCFLSSKLRPSHVHSRKTNCREP